MVERVEFVEPIAIESDHSRSFRRSKPALDVFEGSD